MRHESVYAKELNHEILKVYEEQQLLRETQAGDENAREKLILVNLRLVRSVVQKYENFELGISADDLMADGIVGLCKAISNYDFNFGTRLSTYATLAVHHAVARSKFLNGTIRLPEHVKAEVYAINNAKAALSREGQPLTIDAIAQVAQVAPEQVERLKHLESDVMYVMSLDEKIGDEKDAPIVMDVVADENGEDPYHKVELEVDLDFFLSKLDAHERFVVERSYGIPIDMTNREIGDAIGYHHNDITGMLKNAMAKLKRLARALRGSVEQQKEAIENPLRVMTATGEIIPLMEPAEVPLKKRELKRRKQNRETDHTDNGIMQLSLFE